MNLTQVSEWVNKFKGLFGDSRYQVHVVHTSREFDTTILCFHDEVMAGKHFPHYWPLVRGIHRSPVNSPYIRPTMHSFDVSSVFKARTSYWANSQVPSCWWFETPLHSCDITVMFLIVTLWSKNCIRNLCPMWHHCNVSLLNMLKVILVTGDWGTSCEIALRWLPLDLTYDKSTLVQVMAWCHQATSHHLSLCWPRSNTTWHHWATLS